MNKHFLILFNTFFAVLLISGNRLSAQSPRPITDADKSAVEGIIVEKYYEYNSTDVLDTLGGCLPKGSVTYRIYVDLKPNYNLQAVYGVNEHELFIKTTTQFFNNTNQGQGTGDYIDDTKIIGNTAMFDSYLTLGAANKSYFGIPKADDKDGSILKLNSFASADGLMIGKIKPVTYFGVIPTFFNGYNTANTFYTNNGSWAMFGGIKGPTEDNKILIAQLTTDGTLSFELNIQIGTPTGASVNFVAKNPQKQEIKFEGLTVK